MTFCQNDDTCKITTKEIVTKKMRILEDFRSNHIEILDLLDLPLNIFVFSLRLRAKICFLRVKKIMLEF